MEKATLPLPTTLTFVARFSRKSTLTLSRTYCLAWMRSAKDRSATISSFLHQRARYGIVRPGMALPPPTADGQFPSEGMCHQQVQVEKLVTVTCTQRRVTCETIDETKRSPFRIKKIYRCIIKAFRVEVSVVRRGAKRGRGQFMAGCRSRPGSSCFQAVASIDKALALPRRNDRFRPGRPAEILYDRR